MTSTCSTYETGSATLSGFVGMPSGNVASKAIRLGHDWQPQFN